MTIYLLGLRGSGKTTAGRLLARRLGVAFVDLDELTPGLLGCASAAEVLRAHGEPAFRRAERNALDLPSVRDAGVVSLGGGTPTAPGAGDELRQRALAGDWLIYLRASAPVLRSRLAATNLADRPSLTGAGVLDEIEGLLGIRDPIYRALSRAVVDVDGLTPEETADRIERLTR